MVKKILRIIGNQTFSLKFGFGIGYGIGRKYRPIRVSVLVSDLNQNSGFGRSLTDEQQTSLIILTASDFTNTLDLLLSNEEPHFKQHLCVFKVRIQHCLTHTQPHEALPLKTGNPGDSNMQSNYSTMYQSYLLVWAALWNFQGQAWTGWELSILSWMVLLRPLRLLQRLDEPLSMLVHKLCLCTKIDRALLSLCSSLRGLSSTIQLRIDS